jgi:PAS domain S-box-containing protein
MIRLISRQVVGSLQAKALLAFVVVALVPLVILALVNDAATRRALTEAANRSLFAAASQTGARLDAYISTELGFISAESELPSLVNYLRAVSEGKSDAEAERRALGALRSLTQQDPVFIFSYALLDLQGLNIADSDARGIGRDESAHDYFRTALETGKAYVSELELGPGGETAYLYFSHLVFDPKTGNPLGVLRVRYGAAVLQHLLVQDSGLLGPHSYPLLLDSNGVILADGLASPGSPSGLIYRTVGPINESGPQPSKLEKKHSKAQMPGLADGLRLVDDPNPYFEVYRYATVESAAVARMQTLQWLVVFLEPRSAHLAPAQSQARDSILLAAAVVLMVAIVAIVLVRLLTNPIVRLTEVARLVTAGHLDARTVVDSKDEIGALSKAFNTMTDKVQALIGSLEQRTLLLQQSEAKFRVLVQELQAAVVVHGADTRILISNSMAQKLLGLSEDQLRGKTAVDPAWHFFREDGSLMPLEEYPVNQVLNSRQALQNLVVGIHHPQREQDIWVLASAVPVFGEGKEIVQVIVSFIDITERKRVEQELWTLRLALDNVREAVFLIDENARFRFANEGACRVLGYMHDELLAMCVADVDPDWPQQRWPVHWRELKAKGSLLFEGRHRTKEGRLFPVEISANYFRLGNEDFNLALVRDITERKETREKLTRYRDHLEETVQERTAELRLARDAAETANKAKSVFLANMSHELRTPLNAILGFSQLMCRDAGLSANQRESLNIINNSGKHLLKLINDVLEIAKIEAGKLQLEKATFDLHDLVREVTDMMRLRAQQKGLQLELDQSSEFPRYIQGDEARLRQILVNLVSNAVKFTDKGSVILRLRVKSNARHHLVIEVEDTGSGISKADRKRLFRPFEQLPTAMGATDGGTGLGLAIVRQFVHLMEGEVSVESTPGKGSLFRVELPLEEAEEAEVIRLSSIRRGEVIGLAPGQPAHRILIAEDQHDNQLLLSNLMTDIGQQVRTADDGEECVRIFKEWQPDLIWMDRRMPVMDGEEAARRIRQLPGGDKVKIVAVTASAFREEHKRMLAAGMDGVVRKPYRFNEIYDSMAQQLGLKSTYREAGSEEGIPPTALIPSELAGIGDELLTALREALDTLDSELIEKVIERIGEKDKTLAETLKSLADNFDYPAILSVLDETKI